MTAADVVAALDRLDAAGIEWWVDGGWGVDALLGEETRPHDDLDLALRAEEIARLPAVFPEFERVDHDQWPAAFVLRDSAGRQLDFHPLRFDERGDGWQPQSSGSDAHWPREALSARGRIGEREVRCTSAQFQIESHLYDGYDDIDWVDARRIAERFGLELRAGTKRPGFTHARRQIARARDGS